MMKVIMTLISIVVVGMIALQYQSFKAWLLWGVSEAENFFGSGTGQLKLRYAYNLAIEKFPIFAKFIPFNVFTKLVDVALNEMRRMIEENENIANILAVPETSEEVMEDESN